MLNHNIIAGDDAITGIRFPIRLLTVACLLTITAFAGFGWIIIDARRDTKTHTRQSRIVERIIHRPGERVWANATENDGATFHFTVETTKPICPL